MDSMTTVAYVVLFGITIASNFVLIPVNVNLILSASSIIYIGSMLSLKLKNDRAAKGEKADEVMTSSDAYMFPVIGSGVLFGLYMLFKLLHKDWVNFLLTAYFALIGTWSLGGTLDPFVESLIFGGKSPNVVKKKGKLPLLGEYDIDLSQSEIVSLIIGAGFSLLYAQTKHFFLNNLMGIAFSIKGIEQLSLGTYKVGVILLSGLFFYDIFWVFGTEVMVTVATSLDAPIKLVFPRAFATATEKAQFSILGLGDIVLPGVFIALLLRYDAFRADATTDKQQFSKPYFNTSMVFYVLGLMATVWVMYAFNHAQPALLYLVPAALISSAGTALYLKDFSGLWAYSEEEEEEDEDDSSSDDDSKDEKKEKKSPAKKKARSKKMD